MKIVILPSAMNDLAEGFLFYENQQEDLGDYFLDSIFSDVDSLKIYGGIQRKVFGFHRLLAKRFPHGIYYEIERNEIRIRAVLDCRRDPKWIRQKLK
jgi:ParE toxin of type II toxin-antitoxin system, parDE